MLGRPAVGDPEDVHHRHVLVQAPARARAAQVGGEFWYAGFVRSSVSIALFFLLSGFFLFALLAAIEHSRKALAIAGACLAAVLCIIIFLTPVRLPDWLPGNHNDQDDGGTSTTVGVTTTTLGSAGTTFGSSGATLRVTTTTLRATTTTRGITTTTTAGADQ